MSDSSAIVTYWPSAETAGGVTALVAFTITLSRFGSSHLGASAASTDFIFSVRSVRSNFNSLASCSSWFASMRKVSVFTTGPKLQCCVSVL